MPTFLFDQIIFGPVKSRRLGISLGINLLPVTGKVCNFDCIYCECGMNESGRGISKSLPSRKEVYEALEAKLLQMQKENEAPDVITFAGNGEPTMHPDFTGIIDDTISLRNEYFPSALVSVLSNSTMLHRKEVIESLGKIDQNIMKLDSGLMSTIEKLNQPVGKYAVGSVIDQLKQFRGNVIIQTMFVRGEVNGTVIDNTSEEDVKSWIHAINEIRPRMVMIYTIDRDTPHQGLRKVPLPELQGLAKQIEQLGIGVQVSG